MIILLHIYFSQPDGVPPDLADEIPDDELLSDDEFHNTIVAAFFEESQDFAIPITMDDLKKKLFKTEVTDSHRRINNIVSNIDNKLLEKFVRKLFVKLSELAIRLCENDEELSKDVPEKKLDVFYSLVHKHSTDIEYKMNCLLLFENESFIEEHMVLCYQILEIVRLHVIQKKVKIKWRTYKQAFCYKCFTCKDKICC